MQVEAKGNSKNELDQRTLELTAEEGRYNRFPRAHLATPRPPGATATAWGEFPRSTTGPMPKVQGTSSRSGAGNPNSKKRKSELARRLRWADAPRVPRGRDVAALRRGVAGTRVVCRVGALLGAHRPELKVELAKAEGGMASPAQKFHPTELADVSLSP